jgi:hypothetical protein
MDEQTGGGQTGGGSNSVRSVALQVLVAVSSALAVGIGVYAVNMGLNQEHRMTKLETAWELIDPAGHSDRLTQIETQYITEIGAKQLAQDLRADIVKERGETVDDALEALERDVKAMQLELARRGND